MSAIDERLVTLRLARNWVGKVERHEIELHNAFDMLVERVNAIVHVPCPTCGQRPCPDPAYCSTMRAADQKVAQSRQCAQCNATGGTLDPHRHLDKRRIVYLHPECRQFWEARNR